MTDGANDIEITFLGTGTSQGVPMIDCDCAVCQSEDPRDQRTRSSILVKTPEASWVVDTGPDFRMQALRERLRRLDAVVYTHSHTDHIMGFDDLRRFCDARAEDLPIYAAPGTMADLQRAFAFAFNGKNRFPGYVRPEPRFIDGPFQLGETTLIPLELSHGRAQVYGYLLTRHGRPRVAYLSDCKDVAPEATALLFDIPVLIIDALRHKPHPTHMSVQEALAYRSQIRAKKTFFTHLCHDLGQIETEKILPPDVRVAFDGLRITV